MLDPRTSFVKMVPKRLEVMVEVAVRTVIALGGPCEVLSCSFHPVRAEVCRTIDLPTVLRLAPAPSSASCILSVLASIPFALTSLRPQICLVTAGPDAGYELIEADAVSGDILVRTPVGRRAQHLRHQLVGAGLPGEHTILISAYDTGEVEVWDSETRVLKHKILPSKKDEGKAVHALLSTAEGSTAILYYVRGGSAIERAQVGASKSTR